MLSYQRFLEDTPDSSLTPEAIRRLADLKIKKNTAPSRRGWGRGGRRHCPPEPATRRRSLRSPRTVGADLAHIPVHDASEADFEKRATMSSGGQYGGCC